MKAVVYGAGNIGRGFIGQLFFESGYETIFIDVNEELISRLNKEQGYSIRILEGNRHTDFCVSNVSAISGNDIEAVKAAISDAQICATSVGVNVLPYIATPLREGLKERFLIGNRNPLNIILCENKIGADQFLRELVEQEMDEKEKKYMKNIGFVSASIGRMVPIQTEQMKDGSPLRVCVEPYCILPVDHAAFKGTIPNVKNMLPFTPFEFYIQRKLFIHNLGHTMTAYLGNLKGFEYIYEAIGDKDIERYVRKAMTESAFALSMKHKTNFKELKMHIDDLIARFGNRQLCDTISRVGGDVTRKLSPQDRLVGALNMCKEQGVEPTYICMSIAAALLFDKETMKCKSPQEILKETCMLEQDLWYDQIINFYHMFQSQKAWIDSI